MKRPEISAQDFNTLLNRIENMRKIQKGEKDKRAKYILQTRINHIKETVSRHISVNLDVDSYHHFMTI